MTSLPPAAESSAQNRKARFKKLGIAAGIFIAVGVGYAAYYLLYGQYHEETEDAYVNTNFVYVNAQVSGTVVALGADENQPVKMGQVLVRLDSADANAALAEAEGRLGEAVRQVRQQFRNVDEATAIVAQRKIDLTRAQGDRARRHQLAGSDVLSKEELVHADDAVEVAQGALAVAEKRLAGALVLVDGTTLRQQPSVLRARAAYIQAYLASHRNDVRAPVDGFVARRTVQVGQRVTPGANLLAVIPLNSVWIDANYKEPQLRNIRVGQTAIVTADVYGSQVEYHGKVASIAAGSGGAFSLLPAQNATGNWIKVVQRIPVRIALEPKELQAHPLRVGLSTKVVIDTHERDGRVDTALPLPNVVLATPVFEAFLQEAEKHADIIITREAGTHLQK